ncbi:MAG TPA: hypothetical protein VFS39_12055 [Nitrospira sp.]|nr:hypothetical protein [Nitrospira sp.]
MRAISRHALVALIAAAGVLFAVPERSGAVAMKNDPKGFRNISWGSSLGNKAELAVLRTVPNVTEYEFTNIAPSFAGIPVQSLILSTVDEQFARVTIRYQGEETHKRILAYLEREYGPVDRLPGQMMRGLNQQYNWRGTDSEINLTYQASTERGFVFIDSMTLAPRFNDNIADTAD